MSEAPILDFIEASKARDAGIAIPAANSGEFIANGLRVIASMNGEVQGENIRAECIARGVQPKSHKAWGGLIQSAVRRGLLIPTGRYEKTKSIKTHCHPTQIYEVSAVA